MIKHDAPPEETEDMLLAFELLNKYKKDSKFIQKDLTSMKKQSNLILNREEPE